MIRKSNWVVAGLMVLVCSTLSWGGIIADYRVDYLAGTADGQTRPSLAADGWDYMWNSTASIGTAAGNYSSLQWWTAQTMYNYDGAGNLPRANPCAWANILSNGGHPGRGTLDGVGTPFDRYAIAAYTIQPGENGFLRLTDSLIGGINGASSTGVEVRVYVNDTLIRGMIQPGGAADGEFSAVLGNLNVGDTVYVAAGPNGRDGSDGFQLGFRLMTGVGDFRWDADGASPVNGGTGTWDTAVPLWTPDGGATYAAWDNANASNAYFDAAAGTVTLGTPVTARSLSFTADGYTIASSDPATNRLSLTAGGAGGPGPGVIDVPTGMTATISAPITGTAALTKTGDGRLDLTYTQNDHKGSTRVSAGTLGLSTGMLYSTGGWTNYSIAVDSGAVLEVGGWADNDTAGIGRVAFTAGNIVINGGTIRYTGSTTAGNSDRGFTIGALGATLEAAGGNTWSLNQGRNFGIASAAGGLLTLAGAGNGTLNMNLGGTGGLSKTGSGTWTVNGNNSYSGATSVTGGMLTAASATALGNTPSITVSGGGTLDLAGFAPPAAASITLSGAGVGGGWGALGNSGAGFGINNTVALAGDTSIGGPQYVALSGPFNGGTYTLTKVGNGMLVMNSNATTVGNILVTGGYLTTQQNGALGDTAFGTTVNSGSTLQVWSSGPGLTIPENVTINGYGTGNVGAIQSAGTGGQSHTLTGTITLGSSSSFGGNSGSDMTLTGNVVGAGMDLGKVGGNTLTLRGASNSVASLQAVGGILTLAGASSTTASNYVSVGANWIPGGGNGTLNVQDTAVLTTPWISMGDNNGFTGIINQSGGTVTTSGEIRVAHWPNNTSTYNHTGGDLNVGSTLTVGWDGTGTFNQDGGATVVGGAIWVGRKGGSVLNIRGGTMSSASFYAGQNGGNDGTINHSGGSLTVAGETRIGHYPNETSTYTLSGSGDLTINGTTQVGWDGQGRIVIDGGTARFNGETQINNPGIVTLNGGTLQTAAVRVGVRGGTGTPTLNLNGGTANLDYLSFGDADGIAGVGNQVAANVTIARQLRVGHYPNETSTYNMQGGNLSITGTPSGGGPEYDGILYLGIDGTGVFNHSGGNVNAYGMVLDNRGDTAGTDLYEMTGGTLTLGPWGIGGNASTQINLGGGIVKASAAWGSARPMTLTGANGNVTFDTTGGNINLTGTLGGTGGLIKAGSGTLTLNNGSNSYQGGTTVDGGVLELYGSNNSVSTVGTGTLTINAGGTVTGQSHNVFGHSADANIPHIVINGGTLNPPQYLHVKSIEMTGGTIALYQSDTGGTGLDWGHSPNTLVTHASSNSATVAARMTLSQPLTVTVEDGAAANDLVISGVMTGGGLLTKEGAGTMLLSRVNSNTGGLVINGGTVKIDAGQYALVLPGGTQVTINNGGTLDAAQMNAMPANAVYNINAGGTMKISYYNTMHFHLGTLNFNGGQLISAGTGTPYDNEEGYIDGAVNVGGTSPSTINLNWGLGLATGGTTFTVADATGSPAADLILTGPANGGILQNGRLIKAGAGTMSINSPSTYSGGTNVLAGTLLVNNTTGSGTGSGTVDVNGGLLGGNGRIAGTVNVNAGGAISAGNSPGHLLLDAGYNQAALGTLKAEIGGYQQGVDYDWIEVAGSATLIPGAIIDVDWYGGFIGHGPFDILTAANGITNVDLSGITIDGGGAGYGEHSWKAYIVSLGGSAEAIRLELVPEPMTMILLMIGIPAVAARVRRRIRAGL